MTIQYPGESYDQRNRDAEGMLENISLDYIHALKKYVDGQGGKTSWKLVGSDIYEMVGERVFPLDAYETIGFLKAFCHLEDTLTAFGSRLGDMGFFHDKDVDNDICRFFSQTIYPEHHRKVFPNIANHPEKVYLLLQLYQKYHKLIVTDSSTGVQERIILGEVMVHLLKMGIRPYMLEGDKQKQKDLLEQGRDWVYELSELFNDFFLVDEAYYMAGFGRTYEDIKQETLGLQEKKERKAQNMKYIYAIAIEELLESQTSGKKAELDANVLIQGVTNKVQGNEKILEASIYRLDGRLRAIFARLKS